MSKRPEFDAELVRDKNDGSMTRDDAFEKLNGCENEETTQTGVVDMLRLGRFLGWRVCPLFLMFIRLFLHTKRQCIQVQLLCLRRKSQIYYISRRLTSKQKYSCEAEFRRIHGIPR